MKVLIVVPAFPVTISNIKGGVHSALANLLKGFKTTDIQVRILSFTREVIIEQHFEFSANIDIYYSPESKFPHVFNYIFKGNQVLRRHIKQFDPVLVHFAISGYILAARLLGGFNRKQLVTIHGMAFPEARLKEKLKEKLVWYSNGLIELALLPKIIIHLSKYSVQQFGDNKNSIHRIIPNAVDPVFFEPALKNYTDNRIIYAGAIDNNKNILFLLEAVTILVKKGKFFKVEVLGGYIDEDYKTEVEAFVNQHKLQEYVHFHGWVTQNTVRTILATSDILVVSSKQESLPMVIAEAMAAGKVVVASNVGGISEMIQHEINGYLINITEVNSLITILENLYGNNNLVSTINKQARATATQTYHCEVVAQKTISFYKSLV